jgi:hypothetical protein
MTASAAPRAEQAPFAPDRFFLDSTKGRGVVRDVTGRLIDSCAVTTEGRWDHSVGALHFDEVFTYDTGRVDTLNWAFAPDPQGRMVASERSLSEPVRGWSDGSDYRLRFRRADPSRPGAPRFTYDVRFTLMESDLALKSVRLRLFGLTVATMTAFHRRVRAI